METKLHWMKEAFSREVVLMDGDHIVGRMHRELLHRDVDAELNNIRLHFDVQGFLLHKVAVSQKTETGERLIGHIEFNWNKSAELRLTTGECYLWKRQNVLMYEWSLISENDQQEVIHYDRTRAFFGDEGEIELLKSSPNAEVLILTGLFVRNYFLRRRKIASAG
ncbi:hypothetical protein [Tellurirhabdus rosea]|uniref:hypothetical protein n=1 Tax=Tellurirhabdus rosea TaxID=2674997 RepID=UPI002253CA8F|nr:hypothetical protein [Tellurirhabdus rosea]